MIESKYLNVKCDKRLEFIFAIHSAYLKKTNNEDFDWVECPDIPYMNELFILLKDNLTSNLCKYIEEAFDECDIPSKIAFVLDDNFDIQEDKINGSISFSYGNIQKFSLLLKDLANKVNWNKYYEYVKEFYNDFIINEIKLPNIDVKDIINFYGYKKKSYNYLPSVLVNGGFSVTDSEDNVYAIRGFQYDEEEKEWLNDFDYLIENLFHEISHSYINPLIDKYFERFDNIGNITNSTLNNSYQREKTIICEYLVRTNATILASKYTNNLNATEWIKEHGFPYLQEIIDYTLNNRLEYKTYEEFLVNSLIPYINELIDKKQINTNKNL